MVRSKLIFYRISPKQVAFVVLSLIGKVGAFVDSIKAPR